MKHFCLFSFLVLLNIFSQSSAEMLSVGTVLESKNSSNKSVIPLQKESPKISHPLPVNEAFKLSAILLNNNELAIRWLVEEDYYLYKDKISLSFEEASIENINFPVAKIKNDEFFGEVSVYNSPLEILIELNNKQRNSVIVTIEHQGCWEGGVCYPPQLDRLEVDLGGSKKNPIPKNELVTDDEMIVSQQFQQGGLTLLIAAFLAGLALSLSLIHI